MGWHTSQARSARHKFSSPVLLEEPRKNGFSRNVNWHSLYCYFLFFFLGTAIFSGSTIQYNINFFCTWNEQLSVDRTKQSLQGWEPCSLCARISRKPPEKFRIFKAYTKKRDKRSITARLYFHLHINHSYWSWGGGGYFMNFWVGMCCWNPGTLNLNQS